MLLLPSDLSHFVREVEKCTVVNPGRITRGQVKNTTFCCISFIEDLHSDSHFIKLLHVLGGA